MKKGELKIQGEPKTYQISEEDVNDLIRQMDRAQAVVEMASSFLETEEGGASAIGWTAGLGLDVAADEINEAGDWLRALQDPNDREKERGR